MIKGNIIVDLDGTIALDHGRAKDHLNLKCKCVDGVYLNVNCPNCKGKGITHEWDKYFSRCGEDKVNNPIKLILEKFKKTHSIYIISGRSDTVFEETHAWLKKNDVPWDYINLRPAVNRIDDHVWKLRVAHELSLSPTNVDFVLEDRQRVVDAWRAVGYTCLQVAPGNF